MQGCRQSSLGWGWFGIPSLVFIRFPSVAGKADPLVLLLGLYSLLFIRIEGEFRGWGGGGGGLYTYTYTHTHVRDVVVLESFRREVSECGRRSGPFGVYF